MQSKEENQQCKDMLVRLYELPDNDNLITKLSLQGITVRRAYVSEKNIVLKWVREQFGNGWADECDVGFSNHPVKCFIATASDKIIGIFTYDAIARGVAGPLAVDANYRGARVGEALCIEMLHDMRRQGYAYAILGWVPPRVQKFHQRIIKAIVIEDTNPESGMYAGLLGQSIND